MKERRETTGKHSSKEILDDDITQFISTADTSLNHSLLHTPNPHPGRGIYGFALYLFSWILFIVYLLWAFLPHKLLVSLHLTYLPSKYWAIAVPLLVPVIVGTYELVSFGINLIRFCGVFDQVEVLDHDFTDIVN